MAPAETYELLTRLAANAKAGQWSPLEAVDWDRTPRLPTWIGGWRHHAAALRQIGLDADSDMALAA